jgi:uncharacterized protein YjbJ (UPF0337 family)
MLQRAAPRVLHDGARPLSHEAGMRRRMSDNDPTRTNFVDRLKGKVKRATGAVIGDDQLKHEGELHEEKADADERAARLGADAQQQREAAELATRERELAAEQQRLAAEESADARAARLEREQREEAQRLEREYAAREVAVERSEDAQQVSIAAEEAHAIQERAEAQREARAIEAEAARARATADAFDQAADGTQH